MSRFISLTGIINVELDEVETEALRNKLAKAFDEIIRDPDIDELDGVTDWDVTLTQHCEE